MWNNLKNWQKSGIILVLFYIIFYVLGRLFVPIQSIDHLENYKWPPLIYALFLVLPILLIKYSRKKITKILASIIITIFLLVVFLPFLLPLFSGQDLGFSAGSIGSNNPLVILFSYLYVGPLMGGLLAFMMLFGLSM